MTAGLKTDLRGPLRAGAAAAVLLFGIGAGWAAAARIGGAVIASGEAAVEGDAQVVQHLDGGIVAAIAVASGDVVAAGDVLIRLDPTVPQLNLSIAEARLAEALARRARLEAETRGLAAPVFAWPPLPFPAPDTAAHAAGQAQVFAARAEVLRGTRDRLAERLAQIAAQIEGLAAQAAAKRDQLAVVEADLANVARLVAAGLARQSQLSELQRLRADLVGRIAALDAEAARSRTSARDAELETLQGERAFREAAVTDLRAVQAEIDELVLEIVTRRAQLARIDIRAPAAGVVHELAVTTPGAVVAPGATLLQVIPAAAGIRFALRVDPREIDQVWTGQPAEIVVASFDPQVTPRLPGTVTQISPATVTDPRTGASFFRVAVTVAPADIARLGAPLVPGMPVEAFLGTGTRSVLAYLVQPLTRHLRRAFRED